jgi:hypothetical protein
VVWTWGLALGFGIATGVGVGVMREVVSNSQCKKQCDLEWNFL